MHALATGAGVLLGVVFLVSGVLKAASRDWPKQAAALGVTRGAARLLPGVEIVLGALLATHLIWPIPPLIAALLLVGFTAVIGRALVDGARPVCACFGALSTKPVSAMTVVRNIGLFVLAAFAAIAG